MKEETKQNIMCHRGKCFEEESAKPHFADMFSGNNIVDEIEKDLWMKKMYGSYRT